MFVKRSAIGGQNFGPLLLEVVELASLQGPGEDAEDAEHQQHRERDQQEQDVHGFRAQPSGQPAARSSRWQRI